jgi:hypothetical protein
MESHGLDLLIFLFNAVIYDPNEGVSLFELDISFFQNLEKFLVVEGELVYFVLLFYSIGNDVVVNSPTFLQEFGLQLVDM